MVSSRLALVGGLFTGACVLSSSACSGGPNHPPSLDTDTDGGPSSRYDASSTTALDSGGGGVDARSGADGATTSGADAAADSGAEGGTSLVSPSTLDPSHVYFYGWMNPGVEPSEPCIIDPAQPATLLAGFPEHTNGYFVIRPDGGLTYSIVDGTDNALFVFVGDPLQRAADGSLIYPPTPLANDTKLATPACTQRPHGPVGVFPEDNVALHTCDQGTDTYLVGSTTKFGIDTSKALVLALGTTRTALLYTAGGWLIHAGDGSETPVTGFEPNSFNITKMYSARFSNGSFMVAFENAAAAGGIELGHLTLDGTYTTAGTFTLGTYAGTLSDGFGGISAALDGQGNLYALTRPTAATQEVTVFSVSAAPAAVYNDQGGKAVCKFWPESNGTVNTLITAR